MGFCSEDSKRPLKASGRAAKGSTHAFKMLTLTEHMLSLLRAGPHGLRR
jgi:hypothetical protein